MFTSGTKSSDPRSSYFHFDLSDFSNELNYLKYLVVSQRHNPSLINKVLIKLKNHESPAGNSNEPYVNFTILFLILPFFSKSLNFFHILASKSSLNL